MNILTISDRKGLKVLPRNVTIFFFELILSEKSIDQLRFIKRILGRKVYMREYIAELGLFYMEV